MDKAAAMAEGNQDDELSIPRAALNKMIKELIPKLRVANDSRELILNACTEFIHLVSTEANEVCVKHQKKTISPEHVLEALGTLGFGDYKDEAKAVLQEAKAVAAKKRRGCTRLENLGIPEDELLRQQQELFEKARQEQAQKEQQQWLEMQRVLQEQQLAAQHLQLHQQHATASSVLPSQSNTSQAGALLTQPGMDSQNAPDTQQPTVTWVPSVGNISIPPFPKPSTNDDEDYS